MVWAFDTNSASYIIRYRLTPPPPSTIGWIGAGWRRRCKTRLSLRELDSQGTSFFFWRSPRLAVELDRFCAGRTPHKGDDRIT